MMRIKRKKPKKTSRNIDEVTRREVAQKEGNLQVIFKRHVFFALLSHLFIFGLTIYYIFLWVERRYDRLLLVKIPNVLRILLLIYILLMRKIEVVKIYGVKHYYKIIRHFSYYRALWLWIFIGLLDLYVFRFTIVLIRLIYFSLGGFHDIQYFFAYVALDLLYILDFYWTLQLLYFLGVRKNIKANLIRSNNGAVYV